MTREQIDRIIIAYEELNLEELFCFVQNDKLKYEENYCENQKLITEDLMTQIRQNQDCYAYFIFQAKYHSVVLDFFIECPDKKVINYYLTNFQLESKKIIELIEAIGEEEYIRDVLEGRVAIESLSSRDKFELIRMMNNEEYVRDVLEENVVIEGLELKERFELIEMVKDPVFLKRIIEENMIKDLTLEYKLELMERIGELKFSEECFIDGKLGLPTENSEFLIKILVVSQ